MRSDFDKVRVTIPSWSWAGAAAVVLMSPGAGAQLLDPALDELLEEQITEQVETDVAEMLERQIEEQIEQQVEAQVEESITAAVEQEIEAGVTDAIEQQIEAAVAAGVEQLIESTVTEEIEQVIESAVESAVGRQLDAGLRQALEQQLEAGLELESVVQSLVTEVAEDLAEQGVQVTEALGQAEGGAAQDDSAQAAREERFLAALDEEGRTIERDVWVILVAPEYVERIDGWGFAVREQHSLESLDLVLVRVTAPEDRTLAEAALELALDAPGTVVDYNHLYLGSAEEVAARDLTAALDAPAIPETPFASAGVGIIDTAVATEHEALVGAEIVQRDFVRFTGPRPERHGTAVASILVGRSDALRGLLPERQLHAASVFFEDEAGNAGAATTSLVEALAWLAAEDVAVVNMSLAGPPNRVLETALERVAARGVIIVAAVGNNGPAGERLYPAAYGSVLGITAVDTRNRIYRYANRGPHVAFAAPGVRVQVARSSGGYGAESGTSMAAPHAAAVLMSSLARAEMGPAEVVAALQATAVHPSKRRFDEVFGYGVITPLE